MQLESLFLGAECSQMTSFYSVAFMVGFLPASLLAYSICPRKYKRYGLLLINFVFYWLISGKLIVYLFGSIFSMHWFGLWLDSENLKMKSALSETDKEHKKEIKGFYIKRKRQIIFLCVAINVGVLLTLKYSGFFYNNINDILSALGSSFQIEISKYFVPVGISFFLLQSLSYILDVYYGTINAEQNIFKLALFVSFFPQIVEGPICRYSQTADKLWNVSGIRYENLVSGLQRFLFGMMKKIVVADRLNPLVDKVFTDYTQLDGGVILLSAVCYTIQLYMDFSGSMDAVLGIAEIFGISLPENFARPFFSKSISEFWQRWHITLGTWFKDYIFYPVTVSGRMKKLTKFGRKRLGNHYGPLLAGSIALFCVWLCNGLWHGAGWHYLFFGMYHFILILAGNIVKPLVKRTNEKLRLNNQNFIYRCMQVIRTTLFVIIGEMFFRANGLVEGLEMFKKIFIEFSFSSFADGQIFKLGIDKQDFSIVIVTVVIVFVISWLKEKGIDIREELNNRPIALRWTIWYALIVFIVVFGAYGLEYAPVDPLYAQF